MLHSLRNYLSLVKFSHTVFAMPFAIIGYFLGIQEPGHSFDLMLFVKVIACMIFARTAAMAFNRWADRDIDARNARTQIREIPSGIVKPASALALVLLSSAAFILTTYFINSLCFYLSPLALMVVLGYSLTKRFTWLCHLILGLGLSLAPIGAYIAVTGEFGGVALLFSFTVITWVSGFDIIYALQDAEFDQEQALYSMPSIFGKTRALQLSKFIHLTSACFVILAGYYGNFGILYWLGCLLFCALLVYQHALVKPDDLRKVNLAFFTTNGIASLVFALFFLCDHYLK